MLKADIAALDDDEARLLERAAGGDSRAFEQLYRAQLGRVYALCLRMTGDVALAEDCTQDVFVQAWRKLGGFQGRSRLSTWLHRIAVNTVLTRLRRDAGRFADVEAEPSGSMQLDTDMDLEAAIATLPPGARQVFVLHAVYGYSHEETGEMLGIAVGTSKAQLHRARQLVMARLGEAYSRPAGPEDAR